MQPDTLSSAQDIANVYKSAGNVGAIFNPHYVNMLKTISIPDAKTVKNRHGIALIIAEILTEHEAVFPANVGETSFRPLAISAGMFAEDIFNAIQNQFAAGTDRYALPSVHVYLCSLMNADKKHYIKGLPKVASVQLTNSEDSPRPCKKPRRKYFLVQ